MIHEPLTDLARIERQSAAIQRKLKKNREQIRKFAAKRDVAVEQTREQIGHSGAVSSHQALFFNLISPYTIRRLAERKTAGGKKYGLVQWRIGINDSEYVADRFNHLFNHLLDFMEHGNEHDDNLGAMLCALDCLIEVERLCPQALSHVVGLCNVYGERAKEF
jgi:hypothetical protein